mmetsp:Transcript_7771/g.10506  ORF Transcript_7771/g.10506 Transcript_7771/m.10506 type:complete len:350 (+) Transcript_7771:170-1219(+)|eukprot:CAMPEP_0196579778 /NCGR_PEP_ID=MMETSP1081-20130531/24704_1 /TAXON_ID=36882 /ORGANISM="Pyramimonas amylifera, Strain CCMP720" /LENGTH=349 /DNA_ID=CAMNT_0041899461 /DNA_START=165 /DNA_END=1214 /DNA_ORIENTATION=+
MASLAKRLAYSIPVARVPSITRVLKNFELQQLKFGQCVLHHQSSNYGTLANNPDDMNDSQLNALHPGMKRSAFGVMNVLDEPIYKPEDLDIQPKHREPESFRDRFALFMVNTSRGTFDRITGYKSKEIMTEAHWMRRVMFLETVAGVPGMVAGMLRHLYSLRTLQRDHGWIHTLLEEAENERMHLMTFLEIRQAGPMFRFMVFCGQVVFFNIFMLSYMVSPKTCHRFVGYLEEEAVKTYTHLLRDIDTEGTDVSQWSQIRAPELAINYWQLAPTASLRDVVLAVRADEACHSHVNHTFSSLDKCGKNPFRPDCAGPHGHELPPSVDILKPVRDDFTKFPPNAPLPKPHI